MYKLLCVCVYARAIYTVFCIDYFSNISHMQLDGKINSNLNGVFVQQGKSVCMCCIKGLSV